METRHFTRQPATDTRESFEYWSADGVMCRNKTRWVPNEIVSGGERQRKYKTAAIILSWPALASSPTTPFNIQNRFRRSARFLTRLAAPRVLSSYIKTQLSPHFSNFLAIQLLQPIKGCPPLRIFSCYFTLWWGLFKILNTKLGSNDNDDG